MLHLIIAKYKPENLKRLEYDIFQEINSYELERLQKYSGINREHRVLGFHLLKLQLSYFMEDLQLRDMCRSPYHKPFFKSTGFDFSISHSGEYVVCIASQKAKVGIDIERWDEKLILPEADFLSDGEQQSLIQNSSPALFLELLQLIFALCAFVR